MIERTITASTTAITTYIGVSEIVMLLRSATIALIPLIKHCSFEIFLIFSTASNVVSADVPSSNTMNIIVASPLLNASYTSLGSIDMGIDRSIRESYQSTFST